MVKTCAIAVAVGGLLVAASGRIFADHPPNDATEEGAPMAVPENTVHYLEIITRDVPGTADFYAKAFGWRFEPAAPELGDAVVAQLPDGSLCGIRAPMHEQEEPIVRTYLRVPDLDAAVAKARQLGATMAIESMEIPGRGKIAIFFLGETQQGLWEVP
jgi:predicted enzyme related to lactoylglutathione lyase